MRPSNIRVAWSTCVTLSLLGVGCVGVVDGGTTGTEQQESPASVDPTTDPGSYGDDTDAAEPGGDPTGGDTVSSDAGAASPVNNQPGSTAKPDASVPSGSGSKDAGTTPTPPPPPPPPPPAGDPEAQSIARGEGIYPAMCGGCHGGTGQGGRGPSLVGYTDFNALTSQIDSSMPKGNPGACNRACAEDLSRFIIATFVQ